MKTLLPAALLLALAPSAAQACSCGVCGCATDHEWGGFNVPGTEAGFHVDLRQDVVVQDRLRHGSSGASSAALGDAMADGSLGEIERKTTTQTTTLQVDYAAKDAWGVDLQAPWVSRTHSTVDADTVAAGGMDESHSQASGLGDIRLAGRYQGFFEDHRTGLSLGVKLPTGRTGDRFVSGPLEGEDLDRSLQLGTGSTDLVLGAFTSGELADDWGWFAQGAWQAAVATKGDFRPGDSLTLNGGVRFTRFQTVTPQLQLNLRHTMHDRGAGADPENTGGTAVSLTPGLSVAVCPRVNLYGFVQLPLWQDVRGFQLVSQWNASAGISVAF